MAQAFDTGLSRAQRTLIRAGVVTLLAGLLKANGGYLQAAIPWGGVVRGYTDDIGIDELVAALSGRAPAVAIALGDCVLEPAGIGGFNYVGKLELLAYHYSNHPRDLALGRLSIDAAGLASDNADPGLDVMMEHVAQLVIGQRCGATPHIKQVIPTREEELRTENGFSLWVQRYSVTVTRNIDKNRGITDLLAEFRAAVRAFDAPSIAIAAAPNGATMIGNVATFATETEHALEAGNMVNVAGVAIGGYNGQLTVVDVPTPTTFTAELAVADLAASGGGTATTPAVVEIRTTTT